MVETIREDKGLDEKGKKRKRIPKTAEAIREEYYNKLSKEYLHSLKVVEKIQNAPIK